DRADRGGLRVDREGGVVVGDRVVDVPGARAGGRRGRDRVGTAGDRLARGARGAEGDLARALVGGQEAAVGGGEGRVGRAVDLARSEERRGGGVRVDREGGVVVADRVVAEQVARAVGGR